ncbi:low specificity L-threonine aldolase [Pseudoroseomonas wenyumeiae]|uniref:L-threonine aldolase n=1 Tax=Teichococcus wenyumeiae TaxID=2478470 RepID=A0A3A9JWC2_9PROT|nr:beta-eliminating lyase-related protein [Pseudoroseomonas wenyumeiae]RKK03349.1 low specificity L-threonine aldolase [Pseudoroseomonas wenyumeiae]RMI16891.1 low specificity L-threonine aldolase [Pseudoroseomonas wenyumeiae]
MTYYAFASDNAAGASGPVLAALVEANAGEAAAYGEDALSQQLDAAFSAYFRRTVRVFVAPTGTAANALALAALVPPYGDILCHGQAHVLTTECGAPEFLAGGARLTPLPGGADRIAPAVLAAALAARPANRHRRPARALTLTQATEAGTLYTPEELAEIAGIARTHGLRLHMDGARFGNALAALGCAPAALSWQAGIDILSLGTTKNGTLNAEAVVVFDPALAEDVAYRHKQAGMLTSKMRFVAAQLLAYLRDDHWLANAAHANAAAARLARALGATPGCRLLHPVQTNQVFAEIASTVQARLERHGIRLRRWGAGADTFRLVCSFATTAAQLDGFAAALQQEAGAAAGAD